MNIFVIIVTYNGMKWYDNCFSSLRNSEIPINVIVVDNLSSDNTVDYIKINYPEFILLESAKNVGFGQANNIGIRYALDHNADYVFLLNQDAWIESNTLSGLIDLHINNPGFGILSPMHLNAKKNRIDFGLIKYISNPSLTTSDLINDMYFEKIQPLYETKYINAAAWLLPKKTLEIVGGFDPVFFQYGEDDNYLNRVHFHEFKVGICPRLRIVHDRDERNKGNKFNKRELYNKLMVELTNITLPNHINRKIINCFRKMIFETLKFDLKKTKYNFKILIIVFTNLKRIHRSRLQNQKQFHSWL